MSTPLGSGITAGEAIKWVNPPDFKERALVKSFDSRTYSINDFVEWSKGKTLELNPAFQRRAVWSPNAKSFLMDTILRGKPIPKIFIRQKLNPTTKTSVREVVDGQQRLRTILSYLEDGFTVNTRHNPTYGGKFFSQFDETVQTQILSYEVSVDLLINLPNSEILDIFGRLNSYAVVLNEQEKINADHFGPFKILADEIGREYYDYWTNEKILTDKNILRMAEVTLVADLLIACLEGIKAKRQIKRYYALYEKNFTYDVLKLRTEFDATIAMIFELFPEGISATYFSRINLFYSLFLAIYHCLYQLPDFLTVPRPKLDSKPLIERARNGLDRVSEIIDAEAIDSEKLDELNFLKDIRLATTDETVRTRRTKFILRLMQ